MKITAIKQQVKRPERYSVFVEGKYAFSFSENELIKQKIQIGQELTENNLKELKQSSTLDKHINNALSLIMRRPRSRWEITDYLKRKQMDFEQIAKTLQFLEEKKYLDDYDFARKWVDNRRLLKAISRRKLVLELKQKRVSETIINDVLSRDETDETETIRELIAKKQKQARYRDKQKLMQYLSRQGFNYSDIKLAVEEE